MLFRGYMDRKPIEQFLGAHRGTVQSLDVNPNRFHRATIVGEFDFDEMEEEEEE